MGVAGNVVGSDIPHVQKELVIALFDLPVAALPQRPSCCRHAQPLCVGTQFSRGRRDAVGGVVYQRDVAVAEGHLPKPAEHGCCFLPHKIEEIIIRPGAAQDVDAVQQPVQEDLVVHGRKLEVAAVRENLFRQLGFQGLTCPCIKSLVAEIAGGNQKGEAVFQQVVAEQVVFQVAVEVPCLLVQACIYRTIPDVMPANELYPVDDPQRGGVGLEANAPGACLFNEVMYKRNAGLLLHPLLVQEVEVVQVVAPELAVAGKVPVNSPREVMGAVQEGEGTTCHRAVSEDS